MNYLIDVIYKFTCDLIKKTLSSKRSALNAILYANLLVN